MNASLPDSPLSEYWMGFGAAAAGSSSLLPPSPPWAPPLSPPAGGMQVQELGKELVKVMTVQAVGYILKVTGTVTPVTEAGIGHYVGMIAFPCVLFNAIATIDASAQGLVSITLAVIIAKSAVFIIAYALGVLTTKRNAGPGAGYTQGGMFAQFATNSDDVGFGVPVLAPLFSSSTLGLLYILSALQALLFNPIAFVLLGIGTAKSTQAAREERDGDAAPTAESPLRIALRVMLSQLTNKLVLSVLMGLLYRVMLGPSLPWWLASPIQLLGSPFSALVYLIGGFAFVGSMSYVDTLEKAAVPLAIVALKSLLTPIATRQAITYFGDSSATVSDFAFLYGVLPCANSALVIGRLYGAGPSMMAMLSAFLSLNKVFAYMLLFFAAAISEIDSTAQMLEVKSYFSMAMQIASLVGALWLVACAATIPLWRSCAAMSRLSVHFVLQLAFFVAFSVNVYTTQAWIGHPPLESAAFPYQYAAVNICRWAIDGSSLAIAIDWACGEVAARRRQRQRSAADSFVTLGRKRAALRPLTQLLLSALFGVLLTLPWACFTELPPFPEMDMGTLWWIPYGKTQLLVYCLTYSLFTVAYVVCLVTVGLARRHRTPRAEMRPEGPSPDATSAAEEFLHGNGAADGAAEGLGAPFIAGVECGDCIDECQEKGYHLRVGVMMVCALIRCAGQAGVCAQLCEDDPIEGSLAELLLVMVAFEDGQGILAMLLFGLQPHNIETVRRRLLACCPVLGERVSRTSPPIVSRSPSTNDAQRAVQRQHENVIAIWRA